MPWTQDYLQIIRSLDIDVGKDRRAALILHHLLRKEDTKHLAKTINNRKVIVFGCGPSLEMDLHQLTERNLHQGSVLIAADGAVKALLERNIVAHINVTDLDGDLISILRANKLGATTVVHGHGDNLKILHKVVPHLSGLVYGTTQHEPTDRVHNFGGFTDGDRACYLAEHFKPQFIVLMGMDFGNIIGAYSGRYDKVKKPRKLRVGKQLIETLAHRSATPFYNATDGGEVIRNVESITLEQLARIL